MSSESSSSRAVRSAPRGKNLYERMEEARARRAEVLAAANDDASLSTPLPVGKDKPEIANADAKSAPASVTLSRSVPSKTSRFPAIVVQPKVASGDDQKPRRRFGWFRSL